MTNASLGRPWDSNARVVYLECYIGEQIRADEWMAWLKSGSLTDTYKSAYYGEYKSYGPGAKPDKRLDWTYQLTDSEAAKYTRETVLGGWNPVIERATAANVKKPAKALQTESYTQSKGFLHIAASGIHRLTIRIYSLDGKLVLAKTIESAAGLGMVAIPVNNLKSGSYLIRTNGDDLVKTGYLSLFQK